VNASTTVFGNDVGEELRKHFGLLAWPAYSATALASSVAGFDVKTAAGTHHMAHDESDERQESRLLRNTEGFAADTADFLHVLHAGNSGGPRYRR